ncbi:MAG: hypothetical protein ACRELB_13485 [Polyangiaceae bacterium]
MSDGPLASIELRVPDSHQWGRAFIPADRIRAVDLDELSALFNRSFLEEDDHERVALLERALRHRAVTVETYPGETAPQELHVYVRVPEVSEHPIFACVLAPPDVVRELASRPPYVVMETASFQALDGDITNASVQAALEAWIHRMWPSVRVPSLRLSPWPGPIETVEGALEFLGSFPEVTALPNGSFAISTFVPPGNLVAPEFLLPEQAA